MYQVLYRKWRPRSFDDVIGQKHITKTLKNEIVSRHIVHAYLFTGSKGTGKTSCAKIFSVAVNCESQINGDPCGKCDICKEAKKDALLDISEIDAASNNGVENVRAIKEESFLVPTLCKYRVYIIDEAHMLSTQAFNAFLKILEEPPKHIIFILATTEPHKIPATILSRCQRFEFHRIKPEEMFARMKYICNEENFDIDDEAIETIIASADGSMRDALSLLDRCISCGEGALNAPQVREILGITDKESVNLIYNYIKNNNVKDGLELINKLYDNSKSMMGLCEGLMDAFRDEMVKNISNKKISEGISKTLVQLECLSDAYRNMSKGSDPRLELEIAITKLCLEESGIYAKESISKSGLSEKEKSQGSKQSSCDIMPNTDCDKEKQNNKESNKKFSHWKSVIEYIEKNSKSKSLQLAIKGSEAYENGNFVLIDSDRAVLFDMLGKSINKEEVRNAIQAVSGKRYNLGPYKKNKPRGSDTVDTFAADAKKMGFDVEIN